MNKIVKRLIFAKTEIAFKHACGFSVHFQSPGLKKSLESCPRLMMSPPPQNSFISKVRRFSAWHSAVATLMQSAGDNREFWGSEPSA